MSGFYLKNWTALSLEEARRRHDDRVWKSPYQQAPHSAEHEPPLMPTEAEIADKAARVAARNTDLLRMLRLLDVQCRGGGR